VVGAIASAAGVIAGVGLGWGLQRLFAAFGAAIPSGQLVLKPSTVAISMAVGMAVTFFAAVLPARSATKVAPVAALGGQVEPKVTRTVGWLRLAVGAVFGGGGVLLAYEGTRHVNGSGGFVEIAAGGCVCFVAVLALGPLIAPPVTTLFGWLPGRLFGVPARLASANARRNPHRVAATTAALTIGMTLMTVFTVVISSAEASANATIDQHYPFDYVVQASGAGRMVPPQVISALRASPQLGMVAPHYTQHAAVNGVRNDIGAFGRSALGVSVRPQMISGSLAAVGQGTAAVDTSQIGKHGISTGGTIVLDTPDAGPRTLRIVAVYNGANGPLPNVLISEPDFLRGFQPSGADDVFINAAPTVSVAASRAAVNQATASDPLIQVNTVADYKSNLASRVNQVLALFGTLLGLAILIALFGIANTLSLSVIERTRESALLRAMGLTRGQLRQMLLTEAGLMALLGMALGVGLGAAFGWAMVNAFIKSSGGQGVLSIPYGQIAIYVVIGACAGLLAAVLPARRAAKISVVAAMAEA
jgi:putative ABC transport system permease protein